MALAQAFTNRRQYDTAAEQWRRYLERNRGNLEFAKAQLDQIEGNWGQLESTGSSFTVSNMGMFDVDNFNAIINPGEGAILAVGTTREKVVAIDGVMKIRSSMKITASVDHRIIDGTMAAQFVNAIKRHLEDSELWKSLT